MSCYIGGTFTPSLAEGLPGGATSLKENYDAWNVTCLAQANEGKPTKKCATSQEQTDARSRQRLLAIELQPTPTGASGTLLLPFGFALDQGVVLQIDDMPATAPLRFRTCLPAGCIVSLTFDAKILAILRKASTLKLKGHADGGKDISFDVSLKGFAGAFDRAVTLLK